MNFLALKICSFELSGGRHNINAESVKRKPDMFFFCTVCAARK
jgi:hypothetical protein